MELWIPGDHDASRLYEAKTYREIMELDIYTSDPVLMHSELVLKKIPILPLPLIEFSKNYPTSSEAQEQTMDPSGLLLIPPLVRIFNHSISNYQSLEENYKTILTVIPKAPNSTLPSSLDFYPC